MMKVKGLILVIAILTTITFWTAVQDALSESYGGRSCISVDGKSYVIYISFDKDGMHERYFRDDASKEFMGQRTIKNGEITFNNLRLSLPKTW